MREAIRLGRNFAAVTAAQLVVQVLTFVFSVTLARTLGTNEYGIFVFGFAFPSLFLLLASAAWTRWSQSMSRRTRRGRDRI